MDDPMDRARREGSRRQGDDNGSRGARQHNMLGSTTNPSVPVPPDGEGRTRTSCSRSADDAPTPPLTPTLHHPNPAPIPASTGPSRSRRSGPVVLPRPSHASPDPVRTRHPAGSGVPFPVDRSSGPIAFSVPTTSGSPAGTRPSGRTHRGITTSCDRTPAASGEEVTDRLMPPAAVQPP